MELNERIRGYRNLNNKTEKEMSNLLDIEITTYQKYESGEIIPDIETISEISNIFNVGEHNILYDKDSEAYKGFEYDNCLDYIYNKSNESLMDVLFDSDSRESNFYKSQIDSLLESLNMEIVYDYINNLVYVNNTENKLSNESFVTTPDNLLFMLKSILSIKDNFLAVSKHTDKTTNEIPKYLFENM